MSYAIVFSSKTGNTALLAQTLQEQLPQADCCYFGAPDAAALAADTLYVGFWTDKGKADADTLDFLQQLHGKRVFLFGTAGFGGSAPYFEKILAATRKALDGSNTVIGSFMCQGKMPVSVRQRYEAMKAKPLHIPNLDALIENFDKALSHPDAADLEQLKQAVIRAVGWNFTGNEVVDTILAYLYEHYTEKIELDTLAQLAYCTESHIARVFKKHTGTTIISYVHKVRIEKSIQMIEEENLSVKEAALAAGYQNLNHFYKYFN